MIHNEINIHDLADDYFSIFHDWSILDCIGWHQNRRIRRTFVNKLLPEKGAVALVNPNIPNEVTSAAPQGFFSIPKAPIDIPNVEETNDAPCTKNVVRKAGNKWKGPFLFLCYVPPPDFFIFPAFSFMKSAISSTPLFPTSLTVIKAKSFPPSMSTRQQTSWVS